MHDDQDARRRGSERREVPASGEQQANPELMKLLRAEGLLGESQQEADLTLAPPQVQERRDEPAQAHHA
jgi:hypothetical protein